jgi:DNA recombination protein RmuC
MNDTLLLFLIAFICLVGGTLLGIFISNLKKKGELSGLQERLRQEELKLEEARNTSLKVETQMQQLRAENNEQLQQLRADSEKQLSYLREEKDQFQNELTARNVA